jgi:hypothetical protein
MVLSVQTYSPVITHAPPIIHAMFPRALLRTLFAADVRADTTITAIARSAPGIADQNGTAASSVNELRRR